MLNIVPTDSNKTVLSATVKHSQHYSTAGANNQHNS
jgi:hypothetical protein